MIPVALINTVLIAFLALLFLLFVSYVWRIVDSIVYGLAFTRHDPNTFFAPFYPLLTRPFRELASPQFVASLAILRGEVPDTPTDSSRRAFSRDRSEKRWQLLEAQQQQQQQQQQRQASDLRQETEARESSIRRRSPRDSGPATPLAGRGTAGDAAAIPADAVGGTRKMSAYLNGFLDALPSTGDGSNGESGSTSRKLSTSSKRSGNKSQRGAARGSRSSSTTSNKGEEKRGKKEKKGKGKANRHGGRSQSPLSSPSLSPEEVSLDIREDPQNPTHSAAAQLQKTKKKKMGVAVLGLNLPAQVSPQPQQRVHIHEKKLKVDVVPSHHGFPPLGAARSTAQDSFLQLLSASESTDTRMLMQQDSSTGVPGVRQPSANTLEATSSLTSNNASATAHVASKDENGKAANNSAVNSTSLAPGASPTFLLGGDEVDQVMRALMANMGSHPSLSTGNVPDNEMLIAEVAARVGAEYASRGKGHLGAQERMADVYVALLLESVAARASEWRARSTSDMGGALLSSSNASGEGTGSLVNGPQVLLPPALLQKEAARTQLPDLQRLIPPERLQEFRALVLAQITSGAQAVSHTVHERLRAKHLRPRYTSLIFSSDLLATRQLVYIGGSSSTQGACGAMPVCGASLSGPLDGSLATFRNYIAMCGSPAAAWRPLLPPATVHRPSRGRINSLTVGSDDGPDFADTYSHDIASASHSTRWQSSTAPGRRMGSDNKHTTSSRTQPFSATNTNSRYWDSSSSPNRRRRDSVCSTHTAVGLAAGSAGGGSSSVFGPEDSNARYYEAREYPSDPDLDGNDRDTDSTIHSAKDELDPHVRGGTSAFDGYTGPSPGALTSAQEFLAASVIADNNRRAVFAAAAAAKATAAGTPKPAPLPAASGDAVLGGGSPLQLSALPRLGVAGHVNYSRADGSGIGAVGRQGTLTYNDDITSSPESRRTVRPAREGVNAPAGSHQSPRERPFALLDSGPTLGLEHTLCGREMSHHGPNVPGGAACFLALSTGTLPATLAAPEKTALRVAYLVGADRRSLLRATTVEATRTFVHGTVNFVCFYSARDEKRAARRRMVLMDRQNRRALAATTTAVAAAIPHKEVAGDGSQGQALSTADTATFSTQHTSPPPSPPPLGSRLSPQQPRPQASMVSAPSEVEERGRQDSWDARRRLQAYARPHTDPHKDVHNVQQAPTDTEDGTSREEGLPFAWVRPNRARTQDMKRETTEVATAASESPAGNEPAVASSHDNEVPVDTEARQARPRQSASLLEDTTIFPTHCGDGPEEPEDGSVAGWTERRTGRKGEERHGSVKPEGDEDDEDDSAAGGTSNPRAGLPSTRNPSFDDHMNASEREHGGHFNDSTPDADTLTARSMATVPTATEAAGEHGHAEGEDDMTFLSMYSDTEVSALLTAAEQREEITVRDPLPYPSSAPPPPLPSLCKESTSSFLSVVSSDGRVHGALGSLVIPHSSEPASPGNESASTVPFASQINRRRHTAAGACDDSHMETVNSPNSRSLMNANPEQARLPVPSPTAADTHEVAVQVKETTAPREKTPANAAQDEEQAANASHNSETPVDVTISVQHERAAGDCAPTAFTNVPHASAVMPRPRVEREVPLENPRDTELFCAPVGVSVPQQTYLIWDSDKPAALVQQHKQRGSATALTARRTTDTPGLTVPLNAFGIHSSDSTASFANGTAAPGAAGTSVRKKSPHQKNLPVSPNASLSASPSLSPHVSHPRALGNDHNKNNNSGNGGNEVKKRKKTSRKAPKLAPSLRDGSLFECMTGPSEVEVSELALDALRSQVSAFVSPSSRSSSQSSSRGVRSTSTTSTTDDSAYSSSEDGRDREDTASWSDSSRGDSSDLSYSSYTCTDSDDVSETSWSSSRYPSRSRRRRDSSRTKSHRQKSTRDKGRHRGSGRKPSSSSKQKKAAARNSSHRNGKNKDQKTTAAHRKGKATTKKKTTVKSTRRKTKRAERLRRRRQRKRHARLRRRLRREVLADPLSADLPVAMAVMFFLPLPRVDEVPFSLSLSSNKFDKQQPTSHESNSGRRKRTATSGNYLPEDDDEMTEMSQVVSTTQPGNAPAADRQHTSLCCITLIYGANAVVVATAIEQARKEAAQAKAARRERRRSVDRYGREGPLDREDGDRLGSVTTHPGRSSSFTVRPAGGGGGTGELHSRTNSYSLVDSFAYSLTLPANGSFAREHSQYAEDRRRGTRSPGGPPGYSDLTTQTPMRVPSDYHGGRASLAGSSTDASSPLHSRSPPPGDPVSTTLRLGYDEEEEDGERRGQPPEPGILREPSSEGPPLGYSSPPDSFYMGAKAASPAHGEEVPSPMLSEPTPSHPQASFPTTKSTGPSNTLLATMTSGVVPNSSSVITIAPEIVIHSDHESEDEHGKHVSEEQGTGWSTRKTRVNRDTSRRSSISATRSTPAPGTRAPLGEITDRENEGSPATVGLTVNGGLDVPHVKDTLIDPSKDTLAPIIDARNFPDGLSVPVTLHYIRIGDSLYVVSEVIDRTFIQYRERRVLNPNKATADAAAPQGTDVGASPTNASDTDSIGDDPEPGASSVLSNNLSFHSVFAAFEDNPVLQQQQQQREATARQRRRSRQRHAAVSTLGFGDLTYSFAAPAAPPEPGMQRQLVHMCWRCLSAEARVIFLPCGHYATCETCAEELSECCVCKTSVLSIVVLDDEEEVAPS